MARFVSLLATGMLVPLVAQVIPGEYIALFSGSTNDFKVASHHEFVKAAGMRVTHVYNISHSFYGFAFSATPETLGTVSKVASALASMEGIWTVEPNHIVSLAGGVDAGCPHCQPQPTPAGCKVQRIAPWGLDRMWQRDLERCPLCREYRYEENASESDVTVYIIDTGINHKHVEFEGRASWGVDLCSQDPPQSDVIGHGTHVAGIVMSRSYGVVKKAKAVAVKVFCGPTGQTPMSKILAGIQWAVQHHRNSTSKKSVINLSVGGVKSEIENKLVNAAVDAGITVVVAAGNSRGSLPPVDACTVSPASASKPITVMSSESDDSFSPFSNYGVCGDIIAPGGKILSTFIGHHTAAATLSGTSMASPFVAGAAARLVANGKSPAEVKSILFWSATLDKISNLAYNTFNRLLFQPCPLSSQQMYNSSVITKSNMNSVPAVLV